MQGMMPNFQGINPALAIDGSAGSGCHLTCHVTPPPPLLPAAGLINVQEHASRVFCPADHLYSAFTQGPNGMIQATHLVVEVRMDAHFPANQPPANPGLPNPIVRLLAQP